MNWLSLCCRRWLIALVILAGGTSIASAHPLGNFTINHFTRIDVRADRLKLHGVIDMAEIPTFQERQTMDTDGDGTLSPAELSQYAERAAAAWASSLSVTVDGERPPLGIVAHNARLLPGAGGLQTLRVEFDFVGPFSKTSAGQTRSLQFEDGSYADRIGWREIVVTPLSGVAVFNSSAFGNGLSDELGSYPSGMLAAPLNERSVQLSFSLGALPQRVRPLRLRDGRSAQPPARDHLAELLATPRLTPGLVLLGLLFAAILGAVHAFSPGHGKTVVGAYLVGSRGTARHAAFLGLTVTITHTAGVFTLGLVTLLASRYVIPERLFPLLSFVSGALVVIIGGSLFVRRLSKALGLVLPAHLNGQEHLPGEEDQYAIDASLSHSHAERVHSHLPPGADGSSVTWKSLLALGVSGGILPCPSALVVLLAAISLHRVVYGLLLVLAFSLGLALVLTAVGLLFVYAKRMFKPAGRLGRLSEIVPVASSLVITAAGLAICYEALGRAGANPYPAVAAMAARFASAWAAPSFGSIGALGVLSLGLVYGLKHATEADHVVAVSAIVSEHRKLARAAIVGALWGTGHTASLVVVGTMVLVLKIAIPERVTGWLEFAVAIMIITLGIIAFRRSFRGRVEPRPQPQVLVREADDRPARAAASHSHRVARIGIKPLIVGAVHGLAGSAALTLLVLTQIGSPVLGLLYLSVFGAGSIIGMLCMSCLVGVPFVLGSGRTGGIHQQLQMLAGILSIAFGVWYAVKTGFPAGL